MGSKQRLRPVPAILLQRELYIQYTLDALNSMYYINSITSTSGQVLTISPASELLNSDEEKLKDADVSKALARTR